MQLKKSLLLLLISIPTFSSAQTNSKIKFYGFVSNEFFYNSRQNVEATDGLIHLFPKPIELATADMDKNDVPQAEMLSVHTRVGIDINGDSIMGAKSSGKIEADFAGASTTFFMLRIRQAYLKLNWKKSELLIGQTWHPFFGSVMPTIPSSNAGAPFQPFNRSPQLRLKYNLSTSLTVTASALYQMQYASQGPLTSTTTGASNVFQKNAMIPEIFIGSELKTSHWTSGIGASVKTLKPSTKSITSASAVAYTQFAKSAFQLKAKAIYGQNLSEHLMMGGYGVVYESDSTSINGYANINTASGWVNATYGKKVQLGMLLGWSQNLGTDSELTLAKGKKLTAYGYGIYNQLMVNRLYRIAPHISYNLSNFKLGAEFDYTVAQYGTLQSNGKVIDPSEVNNKRILLSMSYLF